jgi:hypothetical protein
MKFASTLCLFLAPVAVALGQTSGQPTAQPGVASEWDARRLIEALSAQEQHLKPIIDQVQPKNWVAKGASETYIAQWNNVEMQLKYLLSSTDAFSRQPERLPLGLDTYFRMQAMESTFGSLTEGVRKYQNPALASIMQSVIAENSTNRDRLRQYLQDLAKQKEEEFQVADREAQRCRAALLQQPARKTKKVSRP